MRFRIFTPIQACSTKNDAIDAVKKAVCEKYKGYFVDLSAIQNSPNYSFGQGVAVDANGVP